MSRAPLLIIPIIYLFTLVLSIPLNKPAVSDKSEEAQPCPKYFVKTSNGDCKKQITILNSTDDFDSMNDADIMGGIPCNGEEFTRTANGDCSKAIPVPGVSYSSSSATMRYFPCDKGYVMAPSGECKVIIKIL